MAKSGQVTEAERIRRLRGLSVTDLARLAGFSHGLVSQVESGRLKPSARYRERVSEVLGVDQEVAFGD